MKLSERLREELSKAREEARDLWKQAEEKRDFAVEQEDMSSEAGKAALAEFEAAHEAFQEKESECVDLLAKVERAIGAEHIEQPKAFPLNGNQPPATSAGEMFVRSDPYRQLAASETLKMSSAHIHMPPVQVWTQEQSRSLGKALVTSRIMDPDDIVAPDRRAEILPFLTRPIRLLDLVNRSTTASDTVEWVEQTAFTNAAAEVAEAVDLATGTKPESAIDFALRSTPVVTIAHWIPATRQVLEDAPRLRALIDANLAEGIMLRLENQVLLGNGTAPNLRGILATVGILTAGPPAAGVAAVDTIFSGIQAVRANFFEPNAVVMNPADFSSVRLMREGANSGTYVWGPPSQVGPATVFGIPIVQTPLMTAGQALVGDFAQATLWARSGITVVASTEHADFFIKNLVAILAEGRWGFAVERPTAFCNVDVIT